MVFKLVSIATLKVSKNTYGGNGEGVSKHCAGKTVFVALGPWGSSGGIHLDLPRETLGSGTRDIEQK